MKSSRDIRPILPAILILAECRSRNRHRDLYQITSLFDDSDSDSEPDTDPIRRTK